MMIPVNVPTNMS